MHIIECGLLLQTSGCSLVCMCVCQLGTQVNPAQTHTRLTALCPELCARAGTRKVKPIWILLKQETVSGSGISWAICQSALCSRQTTTPVPHHSVFYRPDALPAAQPTASKHWRHKPCTNSWTNWDTASKQTHRGQSSQVLQWVQIGTIWQIVWNHLRGGSDAIITVATCLTFIL